MSSVMAHELRNPLASLKGHAQLLVEDLTNEKQHAKGERIVFEAERLEQLTTSLLDFVRDGPSLIDSSPPTHSRTRQRCSPLTSTCSAIAVVPGGIDEAVA
jgi:signal transduction histidine kinase